MKDKGLPSGLVQDVDTSNPKYKGYYFLRKMFWTYLNKLHVQFSDPCCTLADTGGAQYTTLRLDHNTGLIQYWNPQTSTWINQNAWSSTTTTTTIAP